MMMLPSRVSPQQAISQQCSPFSLMDFPVMTARPMQVSPSEP